MTHTSVLFIYYIVEVFLYKECSIQQSWHGHCYIMVTQTVSSKRIVFFFAESPITKV